MSVEVGDPAPSLELVDDSGTVWRLGDHAGRAVVLIFHRHFY